MKIEIRFTPETDEERSCRAPNGLLAMSAKTFSFSTTRDLLFSFEGAKPSGSGGLELRAELHARWQGHDNEPAWQIEPTTEE